MGALIGSRVGLNAFLRVVAGTALTVEQSSTTSVGNTIKSVNLTLPNTVPAGRLLIGAVGVDKNSGAFTPASGWTRVGSDYAYSSVSQAVFYRIADGSAADQFSVSWANSQGGAGLLAQLPVSASGVASATVVPNPPDDNTVSSLSAAPSGSATAGIALAFVSVDTIQTAWGGLAFTNGYTTLVAKPGDGGNGGACIAVAGKIVSAGADLSTTVTLDTTDQAVLKVANLAS